MWGFIRVLLTGIGAVLACVLAAPVLILLVSGMAVAKLLGR